MNATTSTPVVEPGVSALTMFDYNQFDKASRAGQGATFISNNGQLIAINVYTVTFVEGSGGTITGTKVQTINCGGDCTQVAAVPNGYYLWDSWSGPNGVSNIVFPTAANPLDVHTVVGDMTVTANFTCDCGGIGKMSITPLGGGRCCPFKVT